MSDGKFFGIIWIFNKVFNVRPYFKIIIYFIKRGINMICDICANIYKICNIFTKSIMPFFKCGVYEVAFTSLFTFPLKMYKM